MASQRHSAVRAASAVSPEVTIDTSQIDLAELPVKEFLGGAGFRILISAPAHEEVWRHAEQSVADAASEGREVVEVGGLLIGDVYRDGDGPYVEITAAIPGEHTRNLGAQMSFTPETWAQMTEIKDQRYPREKVVGWYHTHPNFGVFLSPMDEATHLQFFSPPWTTALVVDPLRKSEGFFIWSGGRTVPVSEYWVGRQRRTPMAAAPVEEPWAAPAPGPGVAPESAVSRGAFAAATVFSFLALILVFGYVYMREAGHAETERFVVGAMETQRADLAGAEGALEALKNELNASRKQSGDAEARLNQRIMQIEARLGKLQFLTATLEERVKGDERVLDKLQVMVGPEDRGPAPGKPEPPGAGPGKAGLSAPPGGAKPTEQSPAPLKGRGERR
jgi:proteasome lid subunit RPN8/RPN11